MKKCVLIISVCVMCLFVNTAMSANADGITYAYMPNDVTLYRKINGEYVETCTLPKTYFVSIIGEKENGYYPVSYLDINGYALIPSLKTVDYEPVNKYHSQTATVLNEGLGANLRDAPGVNGEIITFIPESAVLSVYGYCLGVSSSGQSAEWLYVKFTNGNDVKNGYVISNHVVADTITPNVIQKVERESNVTVTPQNMTRTTEIILIVCLSVPAVIFTALAFRKRSERKARRSTPSHLSDN